MSVFPELGISQAQLWLLLIPVVSPTSPWMRSVDRADCANSVVSNVSGAAFLGLKNMDQSQREPANRSDGVIQRSSSNLLVYITSHFVLGSLVDLHLAKLIDHFLLGQHPPRSAV